MDIVIHTVPIEKPADLNVILGQSHFSKTIEDRGPARAPALRERVCACRLQHLRRSWRDGGVELGGPAVAQACTVGAAGQLRGTPPRGRDATLLGRYRRLRRAGHRTGVVISAESLNRLYRIPSAMITPDATQAHAWLRHSRTARCQASWPSSSGRQNRLAITKFNTSSGSSVAGVSEYIDAMTSAPDG